MLVNSLDPVLSGVVVILVTLLLVTMTVLCMRFVLLTALERHYREIGVLKALGVRFGQLRGLYGARYLLLAVVSAVAGWVLSPLLSRWLLRDVVLYMGPADKGVLPWLAALLVALGVAGTIALAVRRVLRRLETVSPVQALRSGVSAGRSARSISVPSLPSGAFRVNLMLGVRDVLNRWSLYAIPFIVFCVAAFVIIVPQNFLTTISRPEFVTYMGAGLSDVRIELPGGSVPNARLEEALRADPAVARHELLVTAAYGYVDAEGLVHSLKVESGDQSSFPLAYVEGRAPTGDNELTLSSLLADELQLTVGDEVELDGSEFTICGIYQDVTNGGRTAKMMAEHTSSQFMWGTVLVELAGGVAVSDVVDRYSAGWPELQVSAVQDYVDVIMGGTRAMLGGVTVTSVVAGLAVAALITGLFMPLLLARDAAAVGVQFAVGFRRSHVTRQYLARTFVVLVPAVLLGCVLANVLGGGLAGLMLAPLGLSRVALGSNPWLVWLVSPVGLVLAVLLAAVFSAKPRPTAFLKVALKEGQ